jgi:hypothetical protein
LWLKIVATGAVEELVSEDDEDEVTDELVDIGEEKLLIVEVVAELDWLVDVELDTVLEWDEDEEDDEVVRTVELCDDDDEDEEMEEELGCRAGGRDDDAMLIHL